MNEHKLCRKDLTEFAQHLQREERSPGTIAKYERDVNAFALWLGDRAVDRQAVCTWKEALLSGGRAPATVNSMLAAVNSLFRFLGWEGCRARYLKIQRRMFRDTSRELTHEEYEKLLSAARDQGREQLALLMETMCSTGIRVGEVPYITLEAARAGRADVSLKGKIRTILLPGKLCRKLIKFARKNKIASGEIFLTRGGKSLSRKQIWAEMKGLCKRAKVEPSKVFPHNLRHLFARTFYKVSRDVAKLADVLGHSSLSTTRIYLISTGAEHARQLEKMGLVE